MIRRGTLAAAIVGLALGAGLLSLAALRWIGFLGLPPVVFLTLLLVGMPVGGVLLVRIRRLKERSLSEVILVSAALAVVGDAVLRPVVGSHSRASVTGTDLGLALGGALGVQARALGIQ